VGIAWCFLLNAVSFAAVIVNLARMRTDTMHAAPRAPRAKGQVRAGLAYAARTPELALPLVMLTVTGILAYEFPTTLPLLATGAPLVGWIAETFGSRWSLVAGGVPTIIVGLALFPALRRQDARATPE
jgi:hypothetical protein